MAQCISPRRVFLADDDEQMHDLLQAAAGRHGHQLDGVTSARDVIPSVELKQPDVIVLDLAFPDGEGHDLLRELKARPKTSRIPVIIWSGRKDHPSDRRISIELGAEDYVEKGNPLAVLDKLEQVPLTTDGPSA